MNVRETALRVLYEVDVNKAYSNRELLGVLNKNDQDARDKALLYELVFGVIKNRLKLDYIISLFSKIKLKKISPWVINILRLGIYQILFLDKIPDSAACNECVKLTNKYSNQGSRGFVNGMLRNVSRRKDNISYPDKNGDMIKYFSVMYSFPEWMAEKLILQYGEEKAENFMRECNLPHPLYVRVNTLKTNAEELIQKFEACGICAEKTDLQNLLKISKNTDLTKLDEYRSGLFSLQNISSKKAIDVLAPKKGDTVFDLCAAPGGKSCAAAEQMENEGEILSFDIYEHKIKLIENSAKRLGIDIIKAEVSDAQIKNDKLIQKADKVIVDAPCSGIGTIHKKPDIKWTREENDILELSKIQKNILLCASEYVKPKGELLYSTCTVFEEENEKITGEFLKNHPDFEKIYEEQILTGKDGETGFYICKMKRLDGGRCG